jgi:hypothetical protein
MSDMTEDQVEQADELYDWVVEEIDNILTILKNAQDKEVVEVVLEKLQEQFRFW